MHQPGRFSRLLLLFLIASTLTTLGETRISAGATVSVPASVAPTSPADSLKSVFNRLYAFGKVFPQERIYLHLDRPSYHLGEVIYFKIYSSLGQSLFPDTLSKTLYVELTDASGTVVQNQKKFLNLGLGFGALDIPNTLPPGVYRLRAFTSWMRNFRSDPLFEKLIPIYGPLSTAYNWNMTSALSQGTLNDTLRLQLTLTDSLLRGIQTPFEFAFKAKGISRVGAPATTDTEGRSTLELLLPKDRKNDMGQLELTIGKESQEKAVVLAPRKIMAHFFPEGGDWVSGLPTRLAFKVTDENGTGLNCQGVIKNTRGEIVAQFASTHLGMGVIRMTPFAGEEYTAEVLERTTPQEQSQPQGQAPPRSTTVSLPMVLPRGYAMEVNAADDDSLFITLRRAAIPREELIGIVIQSGAQALWAGQLRMRTQSASVNLPKNVLPTGVAQITAYLPDGTPLCERLVFVNNHDALSIKLSVPDRALRPRERITIAMEASDPQGKPVQGSFSVAVTDRSQAQDTARYADNLLTHLLLTSEIKGIVEQPDFYFQADTPEKRQALELLLLTQGWRRYLWTMALSDSLPKLKYPVERGIPISGTVRNITTGKPVDKHEVTLMLQHKEGIEVGSYTTDASGRFKFVTDFFGEAKANIQTQKKDRNIERAIELDKNEFLIGAASPLDNATEQDGEGAGEHATEQDASGLSPQALAARQSAPTPPAQTELSSEALNGLQAAVDNYQKAQQASIRYRELTDSLMRVIELQEVEVKAAWTMKTEITKKADKTVTVRTFLDSIRNETNFNIVEIEEFLSRAYPEIFEIDCSGEECVAVHRGKRPLQYVIDGWPVDSESVKHRIRSQDVNCFSKIEIIEDYGAAVQYGGSDDAVVVALTRNPGAICYEQHIGVRYYQMQGYTISKEFFAPDYEQQQPTAAPDVRPTLFWTPHIQTDESGKATLRFFNSDQATKLDIRVQGMATSGTPAAGAAWSTLGRETK